MKVNSKESPQIIETSPLGTTSTLKEKREAAQRNIDGAADQPAYSGPSAAWERDESVLKQETPLPPSEEELDALA